jgi:hypothetical protein
MNQAPTEEKQNAYIRKIKTVQFIYIIEKVGLMNQAPTRNKPLQEINLHRKKCCDFKKCRFDKPAIYINKVGLMNQAPTRNKSRQEINPYKK